MAKTISRRVVLSGAAAMAASRRMLSAIQLPQKVRVAILGLVGHVDEIVRPLPQLPGVSIVALSDPNAIVLDRWMQRPWAKDAAHFTDWHEMLAHVDADVVAVCNDNGGRAEAVIACLGRGMHVIAEKPLALSLADLQRIRTASEEHHVQVGLLLPMRYEPAYQMMKRVVAEGLVGEVVHIAAQKSYKAGVREGWYLHQATYGGTIPWLAPHLIDLMRFTSGRDFREVAGYAANVGAPSLGEMENVTASVFRLDNGGVATLRMDYLRPEAAPTHGDDRLRLAGLKGIVEYEAATGVTLMTRAESPQRLPEIPAAGSVFVDFLESVYAGKQSDLPFAEIARINEIVIGAQAAAREHRMVQL